MMVIIWKDKRKINKREKRIDAFESKREEKRRNVRKYQKSPFLFQIIHSLIGKITINRNPWIKITKMPTTNKQTNK